LNNLFRQLALPLLALPRALKRTLVLLIDSGLCVISVWFAFYLRVGEFLPLSGAPLWALSVTAIGSLVLIIPIFIFSGLYRAIFRYNGLPALMAVFKAMLIYGFIYAVIFTFIGFQGVPRTIGLIQPVLLFFFVGFSRMFARFWLGGLYIDLFRKTKLPQVLIYGAGIAGRQLASAMAGSSDMKVIGFLDDDSRLHGSLLNELPIYSPDELADLISSIRVTDVLLALPTATRERRNLILNTLAEYKLSVRNLPDLGDIASGRITANDMRELDIYDLLGREPVKPNSVLLNRNTHGKTVLVTGAGGSIGSELCRQILSTMPKMLLLVDMSEFALYQIHQELQTQLGAHSAESEATELIPLLASVCDAVRMQDIMATWKPQTVYHAAAYKHVPLVEQNPAEGVRNNVLGTRVSAEAAVANGVHNFVLISTDKAVRPTNVMGASKRLSEMVLQALAQQNSLQTTTTFTMVRFGNVLGSSGSVVPLFREQIKSGGPITLTHADITRYFMTITEAAQLVIQAGAMGSGGDVFVLDMGQPVRIFDLAKRMVELSGLVLKDELHPDGDIEIAITGLRPGEKLFEELLIGDSPQPTQHIRIMKANEEFMPWHTLQHHLNEIDMLIHANEAFKIPGLLQSLLPGYHPSGEVVDWVHKYEKRKE
jgi:FlaA1/EpsC-like NDP-sugar epimerase